MSSGADYPERDRSQDGPAPSTDEQDGAMFADVVNGFTLGGSRGRRRRRRRDEPTADPGQNTTDERSPGPGAHDQQPTQGQRHAHDPRSAAPEPPATGTGASPANVRSYTWTGGRTRSNDQLEMETLVSTSASYHPEATLRMEHRSIAELCRRPRSVAEIAALLSVPIGVARVLLADMGELGLINVHHTTTESGSAPHLMLMERVLSGLRRL